MLKVYLKVSYTYDNLLSLSGSHKIITSVASLKNQITHNLDCNNDHTISSLMMKNLVIQ